MKKKKKIPLSFILPSSIKWVLEFAVKSRLAHQMPVLPLYKNQSIDLPSKSIDWFLHKCNTGILRSWTLSNMKGMTKFFKVFSEISFHGGIK